MTTTLKVGLIQLCPKACDPEYNFNEASAWIREAAGNGCSLAVLPEYHLTSWEPEDPQFVEIAASAYDYVAKYQALAHELKINIVPGTIVTQDTATEPQQHGTTKSEEDLSKPKLLNIAPFISYSGEVLGSYSKVNLWHPERSHLTSAPNSIGLTETLDQRVPVRRRPAAEEETLPEPHSVIETPLGPVGILICWDLAFPEAFRSLIRQGARLIIIPTFWNSTDLSPEGLEYNPNAEALFLTATLTARAFENTCCTVFVNAGGPAKDGYLGLSRVNLPIVGPVSDYFDDSTEGMKIATVDLKLLDIAESHYKIREDLSKPTWHYGYNL